MARNRFKVTLHSRVHSDGDDNYMQEVRIISLSDEIRSLVRCTQCTRYVRLILSSYPLGSAEIKHPHVSASVLI